MPTPTAYVLSQDADQDIEDIYDYTVQDFGVSQAIDYLRGLENLFEHIRENPLCGQLRTEIREGLRSFLYQRHIVFYRIEHQRIRIVRVLHSNRDLPRFLR